MRNAEIKKGKTATLRPPLGKEIKDSVPGAGERKRPGVAAAQAKGSGGKLDAVKRNVVRIAANEASELRAEPGGGGDAVAGKARGKIHAVKFSRLGHDAESEMERAAPDDFAAGAAQLRVDAEHGARAAPGAVANRTIAFW